MNNEKTLFSIGEIAKTIGITRRIVLNYEEKGLITYDVKNGENGNRYYTMDTFAKIHTVRNLQKLGLSLDEIHGYLDGTADLMMMIHRLEAIRDTLNLNIEKLYERAGGPTDDVKKVSIYKQKVYCRIPQKPSPKKPTFYAKQRLRRRVFTVRTQQGECIL